MCFSQSGEGDETTDVAKDSEKYCFYTFDGSTVVYSAEAETVDEIFKFLTYKPAETTAAEE